jgi:hypothetical protein
MKGRLLLLLVGLCGLWSLPARANPISLEVVRLRQVPQTMHVQVTFGVDGSTVSAPLAVSRGGQTLSVSWSDSISYTANTGSGLTSMAATQFCDCDLAAGQHDYVVTFNSTMTTANPQEMTRSVTVRENLPHPDAGLDSGGADMHPWDIPEPSEIQGLDCVAACASSPADGAVDAAGPVPDGGSSPALDGPVMPERDSGSSHQLPADEDDGGCALAGLDQAGSLVLLAGLLLLAMRRRRR